MQAGGQTAAGLPDSRWLDPELTGWENKIAYIISADMIVRLQLQRL